MNASDEDEIKIEYLESSEVDPLCESNAKITSENNFTLSIIPDENIGCINQNDSHVVNGSIDNHKPEANNENDYPTVFVNEETWYKIIDNYGRYLCKFCDLSYSTVQTVRHHVKMKHFNEYNQMKSAIVKNIRRCKLKCHICKKRFKNMDHLQDHVRRHGYNNIQKSCYICHATFDTDSKMLNHISHKHELVRKKLHFCYTCGYSTLKLSHYKQHENTHTKKDLRKCSFCDYSTNHIPNLKIHERIHMNDKPYSCSVNGCGYRCTAKSALYSHKLKHDKEKHMLYCDKCSYNTVYKQSLRKHMDSHNRNSVRTKF